MITTWRRAAASSAMLQGPARNDERDAYSIAM